MQKESNLTLNEIKQKMKSLAAGFTFVRLFKGEQIIACCSENGEIRTENCYDIFKEKTACADCVVKRALKNRAEQTKIESRGNDVYLVKTKIFEVDGDFYVLELINQFDKREISALSVNARYSAYSAKNDSAYEKKANSVAADNAAENAAAENAADNAAAGEYSDEKNSGCVSAEYYDKMYKDPLSDCFNRRYYEEKIKNEKLSAVVALLDIDDFKLYNDVYGHSMGDTVLKVIAGEIKKRLRRNDEVIRYGGDEFLIILPDAALGEARDLLHAVRISVGDAQIPFYSEIKLSVSIGGAVSSGDEIVEKAVEKADALMYKAKKEKNFVELEHGKGDIEREKLNVLIVDDSERNREILSSILKNEFNVIEAENGEKCIEILKGSKEIALVLLDLTTPETEGFSVLEHMSLTRLIERTPVIIVTNDESGDSARRAYDLGAADYITRPFDVKVVYRRVANTIQLYEKQMRLIEHVNDQVRRVKRSARVMVDILGKIVEYRDGKRGAHLGAVRRLSWLLLKEMVVKTDKYKLSGFDIENIATASIFHDIGKITLDPALFCKTEISPAEREIIKTHTVKGAEMLWELESCRSEPFIIYACEICRYHHERYDGSGYPDGLKGDEIPVSAQVVGVATVYEALTSGRVDGKAFSSKEAIEIMRSGKFGEFNPLIIECLADVSGRRDNSEDF